MGNTLSNAALRRVIFEKKLIFEAVQNLWLMRAGQVKSKEQGGNAIVLQKNDFLVEKGHKITIGFSPLLTGEGVDGDNEMKGHEGELDTYDFSWFIDQKRHSVRLKGRMDEQKAAYSMRIEAKTQLKLWLSRIIEKDLFRKMAGLTSYTFANTPTGPTSNRNLFGGNATSISDIDSADIIDTDLLAKAVVLAETEVAGVPLIEPLNLPGDVKYVCFVHNYQKYDFKKDSVYRQTYREAGPRGPKNVLFQNAIGIWDSVLLVAHPFVPTFSTWGSGGVTPGARALFCGAKAVALGFGERSRWNEETDDRGNKHVITGGAIFGSQKIKFNSIDYGVIALDTYAINPNA